MAASAFPIVQRANPVILQLVNRLEGLSAGMVGQHAADKIFYRITNRIQDWQYSRVRSRAAAQSDPAHDFRKYLRPDNPRLQDLQQRYANYSSAEGMEHSVWDWHTSAVRL